MGAVAIEIDEEVAALRHRHDRSAAEGARELIVTELYRRGTVSRGRAAELLGVSLESFLRYAGKLGIPYIDLTEDEWEAEKRSIREIAATLPPSPTRAP